MKKYDRETKKWVEEDVIKNKFAKRKTCKGGREHDFILTLPPYIHTRNSLLGIEVAEEYYRIEEEMETAIDVYIEKKTKAMKELGIESNYGSIRSFGRNNGRYYICSVCKKTKNVY